MSVVTLVNPNKIRPPIAPYALDVLTTSLEDAGFDVEVVDLTFDAEDWAPVLRSYFARRRPLLVGISIRNTDTIYPQEQRVFLGEHREILEEIRRLTDAPVILGGIGFSTMPFAATEYLRPDLAIRGPGEILLPQIARAVAEGCDPTAVPGVIHLVGGCGPAEAGRSGDVRPRGGWRAVQTPEAVQPAAAVAWRGAGRIDQVERERPYRRHAGRGDRVDNARYYREGGLGNILTKSGCPMACAHCCEPAAKGTLVARRSQDAVIDEMESLLQHGIHDLITTDSEFNLNLPTTKSLLTEIIRRKAIDRTSPLHDLRLWVYGQPAPWDEELMDLLAGAGCRGINLAPDHSREEVLDRWKVGKRDDRFYDFSDARRVVSWASERGILTMIESLLGMPGETEDTLRSAVTDMLDLDATVVGFTLGLRVFPYSPLGQRLAQESGGRLHVPGTQSNTARGPIVLREEHRCATPAEYERQFIFDDDGGFRPVFYFSPELPEDRSTIADPAGRWERTLRLLWDLIDESDYPRVMLPTGPGLSADDNNFADNPFLIALVELGYKGAYWARWRDRAAILTEAEQQRAEPSAPPG